MKEKKVSLGGVEYELRPLPIGASKAWRKQFAAPLEQILGAVQASAGMVQQAFSNRDSVSPGDLVGVLGQTLLGGVGQALLGSMDTILEMVYSYAPNIRADAERIEANAYDDEVMLAMVEVLKCAYPFGSLMEIVQIGRKTAPTKKS